MKKISKKETRKRLAIYFNTHEEMIDEFEKIYKKYMKKLKKLNFNKFDYTLEDLKKFDNLISHMGSELDNYFFKEYNKHEKDIKYKYTKKKVGESIFELYTSIIIYQYYYYYQVIRQIEEALERKEKSERKNNQQKNEKIDDDIISDSFSDDTNNFFNSIFFDGYFYKVEGKENTEIFQNQNIIFIDYINDENDHILIDFKGKYKIIRTHEDIKYYINNLKRYKNFERIYIIDPELIKYRTIKKDNYSLYEFESGEYKVIEFPKLRVNYHDIFPEPENYLPPTLLPESDFNKPDKAGISEEELNQNYRLIPAHVDEIAPVNHPLIKYRLKSAIFRYINKTLKPIKHFDFQDYKIIFKQAEIAKLLECSKDNVPNYKLPEYNKNAEYLDKIMDRLLIEVFTLPTDELKESIKELTGIFQKIKLKKGGKNE